MADLTRAEETSVEQLLSIFYRSGVSAKEAWILMNMLETIENIENLLKRLENLQSVDKQEIYLSVIEIKKNVHIPRK